MRILLIRRLKAIEWLQRPLWRSVLVFGLIATIPLRTSDVYYLGLIIQILIFAILALSSNLVMGFGGQASFAHHAFFAIGAYTSTMAVLKFGVTPLLAMVLGMLVAGTAGILVGFPALRLRGFFLAVATLAFAQMWHTFLIEFGDITGGPSGVPGIPRPNLLGFAFRSHESYFYLTLAVTFLVFLFVQNLLDSRFGRALQAMGMSERGAEAFGVAVWRAKLTAFGMSSAFMGLAGGLWAHFTRFIAPESFAIILTIIIVAMSVVGGMRSVWGALVGSIFMTMLPQSVRTYGDWQDFIYGAALMLVLIVLPKGVLPALAHWAHYGRFPLNVPSLKGLRQLFRRALAFGGPRVAQNMKRDATNPEEL